MCLLISNDALEIQGCYKSEETCSPLTEKLEALKHFAYTANTKRSDPQPEVARKATYLMLPSYIKGIKFVFSGYENASEYI